MRTGDREQEDPDHADTRVPDGDVERVARGLPRRRAQRDRHLVRSVLDDERDEPHRQRTQQSEDHAGPHQRDKCVDHRQREDEERVIGVEHRIGRAERRCVEPDEHLLPRSGERGSSDDAGQQCDAGAHPRDDARRPRIQIPSREPPSHHAETHEPTGDREADEEEDDLRDERGPEDVRVPQALVEEVVGAQPEQPAREEHQQDDADDDPRDDPAPPPVSSPLPHHAWPWAPPEDLFRVEAEGAHPRSVATAVSVSGSVLISAAAGEAGRRTGRGGGGCGV